MNNNIVKGSSPIQKSQHQINHLQHKSTSHNSKPSKGSCHSNTSSQEKKDLSPIIIESKLSIKDKREPKEYSSEGKQAIKIDLSQFSQSSQIDFSKLNSKAYIKIINRLFKYLKKILSHEVYTDIKRKFAEEAYNYVKKMSYCLFRNDESQSSIFNYIKCDEILLKEGKEKLLKLSCDFSNSNGKEKPVKVDNKTSIGEAPISLCSNNTNNNSNNAVPTTLKAEEKMTFGIDESQSQTPTNNRLVVSYENPLLKSNTNHKQSNKPSLYHLTKGRVNTPTIMKNGKSSSSMVSSNVNCFNRSKTQSNSKSCSRDCSHFTNNMLNTAKQVTIGINSTDKGKHLNAPHSKEGFSIKLSKNALSLKKKNDKLQLLLNEKLQPKANNTETKKNILICNKEKTIETLDLFPNHQQPNQFQTKKGKELNKKGNEANAIKTPLYKSLNKSGGPIIINSKSIEKEKEVVIKTQYIDLAKNDEAISIPKGDEMIKVIKMSLDDNLKYMLNFSYENFLSKESESQSKQSQDLNEPST